MEEIIRILMRRDGMTEIDAMRNLGLEPDYIMNFL